MASWPATLLTLYGHQGAATSVAFSPDNKHILSTDANQIWLWDADTGKIVGKSYKGHDGTVWSVVFSPDGQRFASGSDDNTIRVWDVIFDPV